MKRILLLLFLFFSLFQAHAQLQPMISYQGELLDGGIPVDGTVTMTFQIGTWSETQSVSVQRGLYSVQLGAVNPIPSTLFRDNPTLSLQISVNGTTLSPNTVLLPVPYAFYAKHIGADAVSSSNVLDGSLTPIDLQSPGPDKMLITDSNGFVLWQDQSFALDDGDWTINPNSLTYTGRVGIGGVGLPTNALDIQGIVRLRDRTIAPVLTAERLYNVGGDLFWNGTNLTAAATTGWSLAGNAGTTAGTDFIGTTDVQDLVFRTNNNEVLRLYSTGEAFFGPPLPPAHTLSVNGTLGVRSGGSLQLEDASATFYSVFQTGTQTANLTYTLPIAGGAAGDVLTNDGTGALSWAAPGLPALPDGNIFVGNAGSATAVALSGDVAIDNTGLTTIQPDAVESAEILDGTIVTADLANDAVNTVNILDDNVTLAKIANGVGNEVLTTDGTGNPQWEVRTNFATSALPSANIFVGDAGGVATPVAMSGDVVIDNLGVTTIQPDAVTSTEILDGTIVTADLANDAVNTVNILDDNVTLAKIADGGTDQVLTTDATGNPQWEDKTTAFASTPLGLNNGNIFIGDGANTAQGVAMSGDIAITNAGVTDIQADAVTSAEILDGTIVSVDLATDAVQTINILDNNVTLAKIADGTADQMLTTDATGNPQWEDKTTVFASTPLGLNNGNIFVGDGANTAQGVAMSGDIAITNAGVTDIQADAVSSAEILDGTIVTADLANDAVNTVNISDDNVTLAKIADGTADQMLTTDATGNPQWEDKTTVFAATPLGLNDGLIFVGDATNEAQGVTMSGDLAIDNTGLTTIQADAVESAEILDGTIVSADLANDAVNSINILDDNVTLAKIADGTADQMLTTDATGNPQWEDKATVFAATPLGLNNGNIFVGDGGNTAQSVAMTGDISITNAGVTDIQADAVTSTEILDGTIVTADLANDAVTTVNISDDNVTLAKIADGTADQMLTTDATGNPQWEDKTTVFAATPLGLNNGNIFVGDGANTAQGVAMSGDISITNAGVTDIQADAVTSAEILDGTIVSADLADNSVDLVKIADGGADQILTTDPTGNPQWENKATVLPTLGNGEGLTYTAGTGYNLGGGTPFTANRVVALGGNFLRFNGPGGDVTILGGTATVLTPNLNLASGPFELNFTASSLSASYTLNFPANQGAANEVLQNDGSGNLNWVALPPAPPTFTNGEGLSFTPGVGYDLGGGASFTANRTVNLGVQALRFGGAGGATTLTGPDGGLQTNVVKLNDGGGNDISLRATSGATPYTLFFPPTQGAAGEVLENDGSGNLSWTAPAGGNTLNDAYDQGGPGLGRTIDAVSGTVSVGGSDGFLVQGTHGGGLTIGSPNGIPAGGGTRMFFNPAKSAFRAGAVTGVQWNDGSVGNYSAAMGQNTTASGAYSMAMGQNAVASNVRTVSMGQNTTASGAQSVAMGSFTTASGSTSTAIGVRNQAHSYGETVVGLYATDYVPASTTAIDLNDRVFTVGIGTSGAARLNAMTIFKNGIVRVDGLGGSGNRLLVGDNNGDLTALPDGVANGVLTTDGAGNYAWTAPSSSAWDLGGNAGTTPGTDFIGTTDNQALVFKTNNLEHMRIEPNGNFKVGTLNSFLEFFAGGSSRMRLSDGAGNEAGFIRGFSASGTDNMITIAATDDGGSSPVFFNFHSNGNLGIQNPEPQERIHLEANNRRAAFRLDAYSPNATDYSSIKLNRSDGSVGGGTAVATGNWVGAVEFNANDGGGTFMGVARILARTKGSVVPGGTAGELRFEVGDGAGTIGTAMLINENGNVGIGILTPNERLEVNGSILVTGSYLPSDRRYKTNIRSLESSLDKIMKLRGVSYFWRHDEFPDKEFRKGKDFGFIAQEIEKVLPEVVTTRNDGYKVLDYTRIIPHLTAALQEQQAQIEALKKENAALKAKAEKQDSQEARLNAMEAQLAELRRALGLGENKSEKVAENTGEDD